MSIEVVRCHFFPEGKGIVSDHDLPHPVLQLGNLRNSP